MALVEQVRAYPMLDLALAIKTSKTLLAAPAERQTRIASMVSANRGCETQIADSRVTTSLFLLRRAIADASPEALRESRFLDAQSAVKWALGCDPLDGNLWLVAGTLDRLAIFEPDRFRALLSMSIRTAPLEGSILERRWGLLAPLIGGQRVSIFDTALLQDLDSQLRYGSPTNAGSTLAILRDTGSGDIADAALQRLPSLRRINLEAAVAERRKRLSTPPVPDGYRLTPFGQGG